MNVPWRSLKVVGWLMVTAALLAYWAFFAPAISGSIMVHTFELGLGAAVVALLLGSGLAWGLVRNEHGSRALWGLTLVAALLPTYLYVSAWDSALGKLGWLTSLIGQPLHPTMGRWFAATWIHGLAAAAQVSMILSIGWMSGRGNYEEQGALDAGPWRVFWHISLHRMLPFVGVAVFWVMAVCSREIAVTDIYQIGTLAEHIYLGYALGQSDQLLAIWPDGDTGIGYGVHVVTIAWFGVGAWLLFDFWCEVEPDLQPHRKQESSRLTVGSWAAWVSIVIVLMVPLATLLLRTSMTVERVDGQPTQVFRLAQAAHAFVRVWSDYRTELVWSSLIGVVGSVVSLALALWLAGLWMTRPLWKGVLGLSIAVTLCIPGPLLGTWLLQISQIATHRLAIWLFDRTIFAPALASMIFVWPLIALVVWQWVRQTNREQLQQSALEGAGQFRQLTSIILGGRSKGVFGLMLIAFALCFSELSAAQMVVPAGIDTVPRLTLGLLHAGVDEMASAISLVAALVISAVALIGLAFFGRRD